MSILRLDVNDENETGIDLQSWHLPIGHCNCLRSAPRIRRVTA